MAELHYKDAGVWRKAKEFWYRDAGTWRKIKELWYRDAGTWRKVFTGGFSGFALTYHSIYGSPDIELQMPGVTQYTLYPTGEFRGAWSDNDGTLSAWEYYPGEWGIPIDSSGAAGAAYECLFTVTATNNRGLFSGTVGSWQSLSAARSVYLQGPIVNLSATRTINIKVRRAADQVVLIDQSVAMQSMGTYAP